MLVHHASVSKLPDSPGVYFFLGSKKEVLYVGKATSLKDRVRSYFSTNLAAARGEHMVRMVTQATHVEYRATTSVLEALILEAKLLKELKPVYNTRDKDDKSFNYLLITTNELFPRLLTVRGKEVLAKQSELYATQERGRKKKLMPPVYGPFPHATQLKEALRLIRKIFPYYDTKHPVEELQKKNDRKLRFNESIGVYPPAHTTPSAYARTIRHITTLFDGKLSTLLRTLEREMRAYAKAKKFEEAALVKKQLFALQHIEDVSLIRREHKMSNETFRVEGYDIAHLMGKDTVGVMVVVEHGEVQKKEYRTFTIRGSVQGSDTGAFKELLERRLAHPEWQYPRLMVVDGGVAQLNVVKKVLKAAGVVIPVVAVTKDAHHNPRTFIGPIKQRELYHRDVLLANAEAHRFSLAVHTKKRGKRLLQ